MGWWRDPPEIVTKIVGYVVVAALVAIVIAVWWSSGSQTSHNYDACVRNGGDPDMCAGK